MGHDDGVPKGVILTEAYGHPAIGSAARYTVPIYEEGIRWGHLIVGEDFGSGELTARMDTDIRLLR